MVSFSWYGYPGTDTILLQKNSGVKRLYFLVITHMCQIALLVCGKGCCVAKVSVATVTKTCPGRKCSSVTRR
jgi:hypothetical protein